MQIFRRVSSSSLHLLALLHVLALVGCDGKPPDTKELEPIFEVRGKLGGELDEPRPSELRVTLLWFTDVLRAVDTDTTIDSDTDEFSLRPSAGSAATLLQPTAAASDAQASGARAAIVLYQDANSNQTLDLATKGDEGYVDRIYGVVQNRLVHFGAAKEGAQDASLGQPPSGFSLARVKPARGQFLSVESYERDPAPVLLELDYKAHEDWKLLACSDITGHVTTKKIVTETPADHDLRIDPIDDDLVCKLGGRSYKFITSCRTVMEKLCIELNVECESVTVELETNEAVPPGWPCRVPN